MARPDQPATAFAKFTGPLTLVQLAAGSAAAGISSDTHQTIGSPTSESNSLWVRQACLRADVKIEAYLDQRGDAGRVARLANGRT